MVTLVNDNSAGGSHANFGEHVIAEFTSREQHLRSLKLLDAPVSEISSTLSDYISVLYRNLSIALGRGQTLTSTRLSKGLESVFSSAAPNVIKGPPISWTELVLSVGPSFQGMEHLRIGESEIHLLKDDFDLICSGRAWRFLSPWPGADDCQTELQAIDTSLEELFSLKQSLSTVMENISSVEYQLVNWRNEVTQLYEDQRLSTIPRTAELYRGCTRQRLNQNDVLEAATSGGDANLSHLCQTSAMTESSATPLPVESTEEQSNRDLSISALTQSSSPSRSSEPARDAITGSEVELRGSNFIRTLSTLLDDSDNAQIIWWSSDGCSFSIAEKSKFPPELLIRLEVATYEALIRRLYYYGFHKCDGAFYHELFIRGQSKSLHKIRPKHRSASDLRSSSQRRPRVKVIRRKRNIGSTLE
ncbi:hypothetical protein BGW36DRAFT_347867 [Talaromyces proteolyticus]|uniref:HSF-type DNA-binding domain-containing protein n=1 Tax=Talaromyces proteolyticus TaxID=1131652 RepID=A0AAD4KGL5_9EURO|nr:uncharacterized protein BGW36DRAFT_347867 [Talaromyces proteolyticus]KAH8691908.1 hypothetical protein BGW36DRAFT_347867 [Talaromyces proteolyticus]